MDIYLVGGAVRDKLLGLPVSERDWVVVGAAAQEMVDLGYQAVGKDFPVFLHPKTREEYALARTERKTAPGYTGFDICADPAITLEEDLLRRDLTINAMAETAQGELIDPYGGRSDLDNGLLRHVSPAFSEDPVRVLRVARFAARFAHYGFHVAHDTNALMRRMVDNGEIDYLVAERVWAELHKALASNTPARFFTVLASCGALKTLFPEIAELNENKATAHEQTQLALPVLSHAVDMSDNRTIRLAALVCDIDNGISGGLDRERLDAFCERLRLPNSYRELAAMALQYRQRLHDSAQLSASELLDLLTALDAFRRAERLADFIAVCAAEAHSMNPALHDYAPADLLERALLAAEAVTPDTAGKSGKEIGETIRVQRTAAIENILL